VTKIKRHPKFDGIYTSGGRENQRYYTLSADKNHVVYGEKLIDEGDLQYREWNPYRSKLCSAIVSNARKIFINKNSSLLYLGASSGTTVSHCSDIVTNGTIYAVEFSPRSLRELVQNCVDRTNVIPILGDANQPAEYAQFISGRVDVIFQDVAQPNQTEILIKNVKRFLEPRKGNFIYAIKPRSIDTAGDPTHIFNEQIALMEKEGLQITDNINISSYQIDHIVLFGRYLGDPAGN
jgi:fibrillarin-like pre-rRNA processing protein